MNTVELNSPDVLPGYAIDELQEELAAAIRERDLLTAEGKRRFPRGFTGNDIPGEFESWEEEWCEADREVRTLRAALAKAVA